MLTQEMIYKADCFDYLCWLEETHQRDGVKEAPFLVMASDGTTCWGKSYADCVKVAMNHDKELYDAVKALVVAETEPPNDEVSDRRAHGNDNTTGANGGSLH